MKGVHSDANAAAPDATAQGTTALRPATVPAVLRAAADLIEPEGAWIKGHLAKDEHGWYTSDARRACRFCAVGAIRAAAGAPHLEGSTLSLNARLFVNQVIGFGKSLPSWNDAPERTQAEVVSALRKAADLAEAEGARA